MKVQSSLQYRPSIHRLQPQYRRWFSSPEYVFSWLYYMTPFTAVFNTVVFFTSLESGSIGVVDSTGFLLAIFILFASYQGHGDDKKDPSDMAPP